MTYKAVEQPTARHLQLARVVKQAAENAGLKVLKTHNRAANVGMAAELALAIQLAAIIDGEIPAQS